jgi:hypothetical protein
MSTFDSGTGITAINTILAEEANRIGQDIYRRTLHTSPWMDLIKQSAFPDGMGYQLTTMVYDRSIPVTSTSGNVAGVNWSSVGSLNASANVFNTSSQGQLLTDTASDAQGGRGTGSADKRSFIKFTKQLKPYTLDRAVVESPRISVEDLRFAVHRQEQLRALMDAMTEATKYTWENRNRDEFESTVDNLLVCKSSASVFNTGFEGTIVEGLDSDTSAYAANANISNAVLDKAYFSLVRKGAGTDAYGRENGRPVFALVISSEASYELQTEAGFRDDVRYNQSKVSDLIAPLGVEKAFRGFYHLIDDFAPRYTLADSTNLFVRQYPVTIDTAGTDVGRTIDNPAYDSAPYELAFILHPHVMESQIPNPLSGANGITFNPVNYRGDFKWTNILNEITNPDGTIGFFRGILASATKPIKTDYGYAILFKRDSTTPAAV